MNHPLKSLRKKSQEDSELDSSIGGVEMSKSRNKSFNTGGSGLRKFTSKDLSMEQLEDIEFNKVSIKDDYSQLMNERMNNNDSERYDFSERKIGSSGAQRINKHPRPISQNPTGSKNNFRKSNFVKQGEEISFTHEEDSLKEYYNKEDNHNSKSKGKSKKKEITRERSAEDNRRLKQLSKIYLTSPHKWATNKWLSNILIVNNTAVEISIFYHIKEQELQQPPFFLFS